MSYTIDTSGLSCPQPVLEVKKFIDAAKASSVEVLTDNPCSQENIRRFAATQGWVVRKETITEQGTLLFLEKS